MFIEGLTPEGIIAELTKQNSEIPALRDRLADQFGFYKRAIAPYQGAVLYTLCKRLRSKNHPQVLELGTALGYSAAWMAEALPHAMIDTLNPKQNELQQARLNLQPYENVFVQPKKSWDFFQEQEDTDCHIVYDFIFVDGDHGQVVRDLVWWNRLAPGGLIVFHDYSPEGTGRPCQPVYHVLNAFMEHQGVDPAVLVVDDEGVGMIGFRREDHEEYKPLDVDVFTWKFDPDNRRWLEPAGV